MRTVSTTFLAIVCTCIVLVFLPNFHTYLQFTTPIDAISFKLSPGEHIEVRGQVNGSWQVWQTVELETEFDPLLRESSVVIFPESVQTIQLKGSAHTIIPHPIRLSGTTPSYQVAALVPEHATRKILLRRQWGANDDFLVQGESVTRSDTLDSNGNTALTDREQTCVDLQAKYPNEFKVSSTKTTDALGRTLRWPQQYSPSVHTIVVHHTASSNATNTRSGYETMQALYAYHANNRGWGDIGYHYIVDDAGQIYEGKAGGKFVVGGHSYCSNVGTIGIALMGNFETDVPSKAQTESLQWLLDYVAKEYKISLTTNVQYQGKIRSSVVGHRDLVSTTCPGGVLYPALTQITSNAAKRKFTSVVKYDVPVTANSTPLARVLFRTAAVPTTSAHELQFAGESTIVVRPSGFTNVQMLVRTGSTGLEPREAIATITRSNPRIGIWQLNAAGEEVRALNRLVSFKKHSPAETLAMPLRIQAPEEDGTYTIRIGQALLRIKVEGRRNRADDNPLANTTNAASLLGVNQRARTIKTLVPTSTSLLGSSLAKPRIRPGTTAELGQNVRIKLGHTASTMTIDTGVKGTVNGKAVNGTVTLTNEAGQCVARQNTTLLAQGTTVKISSSNDSLTVSSWQQTFNVFRGVLECRVQDGALLLINELPLEHYMWGLSEEPDTEPYEKQRAFAIAARSYLVHYLSPNYRKFPGKPYDGSDSPAEFQKYSGKAYEAKHPRWVEAVKSTALTVVKKQGQVVKTPYYSANDGRTRSPAERGWGSFLFAEVFSSKPDPWCIGDTLRGHGVGMSGCGAKGQALEGKTGEEILQYYYTGVTLEKL